MNLALLGLTSEQVTFALIIALVLFFLYLQVQRFARIGRGENGPPGSDDARDESDDQNRSAEDRPDSEEHRES